MLVVTEQGQTAKGEELDGYSIIRCWAIILFLDLPTLEGRLRVYLSIACDMVYKHEQQVISHAEAW